jgi:hypothetical protein
MNETKKSVDVIAPNTKTWSEILENPQLLSKNNSSSTLYTSVYQVYADAEDDEQF